MKKAAAYLLALCLALGLCLPPSAAAAEEPLFFGKGTADEPYHIATAQDLRALSERVNAGDENYNAAHYMLTADINLSEARCREDYAYKELSFTPIGLSLEAPFRGEFCGNGHIVFLEVNHRGYGGLFGVVDGGVVHDVTVAGSVSSTPVAGGIVGLNHGGKIYNCVAGAYVSAIDYDHRPMPSSCTAGGIVGANEAGGLVANSCYTDLYGGRVYGEGIVHSNREDSQVVNCFSCGEVSQFWREGEWEHSYLRCDPEMLPEDREDLTWHFTAYFTDESGKLTPVNRWVDDGVKKAEIFGGETTLLGALNAWVDAQDDPKYNRWVQRPGEYPLPWTAYTVECSCELGEYIPYGMAGDFTPFVPDGYSLLPFLPCARLTHAGGAGATVWLGGQSAGDFRLYEVLLDGVSHQLKDRYTFPGGGGDHTLVARYVWAGSFDNFKLDTPYKGYADVDENAWYGSAQQAVVKEATQLGLFSGDQFGNFRPEGELSLAEAVKLAAVVRDTWRGEGYPFDQSAGEHWYDTYISYALDCGILQEGEFDDYTRPATRAEMADIFYNCLPYLTYERQLDRHMPPDVSANDPHLGAVVTLYQSGILLGSDALSRFRPNDTITRAEVAAIAARMALPSRRVREDRGPEEILVEEAWSAVLVCSQPYGVKDYALYLVSRETGQARKLLLPSTYAGTDTGGEPYLPTDRPPDELVFNDYGRELVYTYRFDQPLEAEGATLHEAGFYRYRVNTATGELTVEHYPE